MKEYTLEPKEEDTLKLNIGEESFLIPLATSMTLEEASSMDTMDGAISFFKKYIREEVANTLSLRNWRDLIRWWKEASEEATQDGGMTPGES